MIAFEVAETNVCAEVSEEVPTLTVIELSRLIIPFAEADTNVWTYWSAAEEGPTLTVNVLSVFAVILNHLPEKGSVERGYVLVSWLPSFVQVKDSELSAILILSPTTNPWEFWVITKTPSAGL